MKDKIRRFWDEHETFQSVVVTVTGATIALGAMAIIVNGTKVTGATEFTTPDGREGLMLTHKNGKITRLRKNKEIAEV